MMMIMFSYQFDSRDDGVNHVLALANRSPHMYFLFFVGVFFLFFFWFLNYEFNWFDCRDDGINMYQPYLISLSLYMESGNNVECSAIANI